MKNHSTFGLRTAAAMFATAALGLIASPTAMADDPVANPSPSPAASAATGSGDLCALTETHVVKGKPATAGTKGKSDGKGKGKGKGNKSGSESSAGTEGTPEVPDTIVTETTYVPCDTLEGSERSHGVWGAYQRREALTRVAEKLAAHSLEKGEGWTSQSLARMVVLLNAYLPESMWVSIEGFLASAAAALDEGAPSDPTDDPTDDESDDADDADDTDDTDQDEPADA